LEDRQAGTLTQNADSRLTMSYAKSWLDSSSATPVSLSMPVTTASYTGPAVRAYLEGLLPDDDQVLERWGRTYHVSARNPFALLRHVGEDCAGAVQLVRPERLAEVLSGKGHITWLSEEELTSKLASLVSTPANWHLSESGQFSLAGMQTKTALHLDPTTGRWGQPRGAAATTHIFKPAVPGFVDHELNEHLCLSAAFELGLESAQSQIQNFGQHRFIVVTRYDRYRSDEGQVLRLHQEDMCQALGISSRHKYQNEGGPTPEQIVGLLRNRIRPQQVASEAIERFTQALAFNWLVGGTDAHAKNYSLLLAGGQVRLAPLYDVASALPYDDMYLPKLRMAMRIGREYRLERIQGRHWRRFAVENRLDPDRLIARIDDMARHMVAAFETAAADPSIEQLDSPMPQQLVDAIARRIPRCREFLQID
jgi:serine/threonine-protein kinase HipA